MADDRPGALITRSTEHDQISGNYFAYLCLGEVSKRIYPRRIYENFPKRPHTKDNTCGDHKLRRKLDLLEQRREKKQF